MSRRNNFALMAALLAAACNQTADPARDGKTNAAANQAAADPMANQAANAAEPAAPAGYTLAGNGLSPGVDFGMGQAEAVAAATKAFGPSTGKSHNDECGEGPMDFVGFHDLQLGFQEGKLAGWSLGGKTPALKTAGGIAIGTPRSALARIEIDEQSSLGPEFTVDEVGGILGEDGKVMALWAGYPCQFR